MAVVARKDAVHRLISTNLPEIVLKMGDFPRKKRADGLARSGCLLYSPGVHVSFMIDL